jgi:hypothetical protein
MSDQNIEDVEEDYTQKEVNNIFLEACKRGKLNFVKFFMHDKNLKYRVNLKYNGNDGLVFASNNNHYDIVEYLLQYQEVRENLCFDLDNIFINACANNLTGSLKVLLQYAKDSNIDLPYKDGFSNACNFERLDALILLTSYKYIRDSIGNDFMLKEFDLATKHSRESVIKFFLTHESLDFRINSKYYFHKISGFNPYSVKVKVSGDSKPFLETYNLNNDLVGLLKTNNDVSERPKKRLKL